MIDTYSAIQAAMLNDNNRLTIISQNISNASTAGYKRKISVNRSFSEYMTMYSMNRSNELTNNNIQVGLPYLESKTDPSMGAVTYTGNPFDLVAEGNSYFSVITPSGVAYTKQGSFKKNAEGLLVNQLGYPILGDNGEISLTGMKPKIDENGNLIEDGKVINKIKVTTFTPGTELNDIGYGLYVTTGQGNVKQDVQAKVRQGYQEVSNVVLMDEMVKMIDTMRHFETSQHFMRGYDDMLDKAINVIGEV
jgi:flagellar basal-body rod protein FlgF